MNPAGTARHLCLLTGTFALVCVLGAQPIGAQAWVPEKGEGSVTILLSQSRVGDHIFSDNYPPFGQTFVGTPFEGIGVRKVDLGKITSRNTQFAFRYSFAKNLAIDADVTYVNSKYEGVRRENPARDNGQWQGDWQNASASVRWMAYNKKVTVTPQIGVVIPTNDYETFGHTAVGRGLNEVFVGVSVGSVFGTRSASGYVQGRYAYSFVENFETFGLDRSSVILEFGLFATPSVVLRSFGTYSKTHDGFDWLDITPGNFHEHDVAAEAENYGAGFETVFTVAPTWDLSLGIDGILDGGNTHELTTFRVGVTYNFGRSLQFAPVAPVRDAAMKTDTGLDLSRTRTSEGGHFVVTISSTQSPLPLNRVHEWTVRVSDAEGNPVEDADVEIQGGMPEHDHDFPTQPQVTRNLGRGNYLVEGVKFNMGGWWEFTAVIRADGVEDKITFNILLDR